MSQISPEPPFPPSEPRLVPEPGGSPGWPPEPPASRANWTTTADWIGGLGQTGGVGQTGGADRTDGLGHTGTADRAGTGDWTGPPAAGLDRADPSPGPLAVAGLIALGAVVLALVAVAAIR